MVPGYLAFISGIKQGDLKNDVSQELKNKIRKNSIFFVLGFSVTFVFLGFLLGAFGSVLGVYRNILLQISGVLIVFFGLTMIGVYSLPFLNREYKVSLPSWLQIGKPKSSFLIGGIFALGWSPCVGPILGTILVLAGTLGTAFQGTLLLSMFSLGLAIPFLLVAFLYGRSQNFLQVNEKIFKTVSLLGGLVMVLIGILLLFNEWTLFQEWGFKIFDFIKYQKIQEYL
jgi:cytochrome c-type biogenesis protein